MHTCSYRLLHSLIRTAPFQWLLNTGHVLMDFCIRWYELLHFVDFSTLDTCSYALLNSLIQTVPIRWLLSSRPVLIWTLAFADSNRSISVTTQHWTRAQIDFRIRRFELLHFGDYSALDACPFGLFHSQIRTSPFRWLLSTGHVLIWTFAFADSNCYISVNTQHWTRAQMYFCISWYELLNFGDYSALETCS
jgi:hypothetical protein